jgi:hypothetical protein
MPVRQRIFRVCGQPFPAVALTCSVTCRWRLHRHPDADLAYLGELPPDQARARRFVHDADLDSIATARAVAASRREGRRQRRRLPQVRRMKARTAG